MARKAGVQFEKDAKGRATYVRFDLKIHGILLESVLKQLDTSKNHINKTADGSFDFEKEWAVGISGKQLQKRIHAHIDKIYDAAGKL